MSLMSVASYASIARGYDYYNHNKVKKYTKLSDCEYEGIVNGSNNNSYQVKINTEHVRKSKCNCPHADGRRIICKHMIALYFTFFPKEAEEYIRRVEQEEREYEEYEDEYYDDYYEEIVEYVNSLTEEEVREELINVLLNNDREFY